MEEYNPPVGGVGGGALAVDALEEGQEGTLTWGNAAGHADQLLDWERIMANTRSKAPPVQVRDPLGNIVTPPTLEATLPDFNEWALPYVLVQDDGKDVGNWGGFERAAHTRELAQWEGRLVQHFVYKPLQAKHGYSHGHKAGWCRTIDLGVWRDAYNYLDSLGFLKGDFCSPLGMYMASLLHGVD